MRLGKRSGVTRTPPFDNPQPKLEVLFFPFGPAATGKSTLLAAVQAALGDYAAQADFETLLAQKGDGAMGRRSPCECGRKWKPNETMMSFRVKSSILAPKTLSMMNQVGKVGRMEKAEGRWLS